MITLSLSPLYARCLLRVLQQSDLADYHVVAEIIAIIEEKLK